LVAEARGNPEMTARSDRRERKDGRQKTARVQA